MITQARVGDYHLYTKERIRVLEQGVPKAYKNNLVAISKSIIILLLFPIDIADLRKRNRFVKETMAKLVTQSRDWQPK